MGILKYLLPIYFISASSFAATLTTPNMGLTLPVPGTESGPTWAQLLNTALTKVDQHTHAPGAGSLIPVAGLNVNADLPMGNFNLFLPRATLYTNQSAPLATSADKNSVYVVNGDLYYNNASGTPVQVTSGTAVNVSGFGGISGMGATTASAAYSDITKTFTFTQASGQTADIAAGTYNLYEDVVGAQPISIKSPSSVVSSYNFTLPAATPLTTLPVQMQNSGSLITGQITLAQLVTAVQNALVPAGSVIPYVGAAAPANYLLCDGTSYLNASYPDLYSVIGCGFGCADGSHFNVPDLRGRVIVGSGTGSGLTARAIGNSFGEETHILTIPEMPSHSHTLNNATLLYRFTNPSGIYTVTTNTGTQTVRDAIITANSTGGGGAHNVMQPSLVTNYIIKY